MRVERNYRDPVLARWLLAAATLTLACSCQKHDGDVSATTNESLPATGTYAPRDDVAKSWGAFDLYTSHATLAAFQGHIVLEPAGRLPSSAGDELVGAHVYRIVNAQEFHEHNKGRDVWCLAPARWLAIKTLKGQLRVALLTSDQWQQFDPKKPGFCGSGLYEIQ